jgi:uncharacterized protein (TIGR03067 family)
MRAALATAALVFVAGVAGADDAAAKRMLKDLEGSYTPVSMTRAGEAAPADVMKAATFQIEGDTFTVRFNKDGKEEGKRATIVLDPAQKPTAIDLTPKDGPDAGKPMLGILKVEKDTVTICWTDQAGKAERPKDFSSTKENGNLLIVLKKAR